MEVEEKYFAQRLLIYSVSIASSLSYSTLLFSFPLSSILYRRPPFSPSPFLSDELPAFLSTHPPSVSFLNNYVLSSVQPAVCVNRLPLYLIILFFSFSFPNAQVLFFSVTVLFIYFFRTLSLILGYFRFSLTP